MAAAGCSKSTAPAAPADAPTVLCGTVTDSLGNPLDSMAIKIQYNLPAPVKSGNGSAKDSVSSFTVSHVTNGFRLDWRTESETNCFQWEIQRSCQADSGYVILAIVAAMGNSSIPHDYAYTDTTVTGGNSYYYRLCSVDLSGLRTYYGPVAAGPLPVITDGFTGCRPVPVIGSAQIGFRLAGSSMVSLGIKRNGVTVRSLVDATLSAGSHLVVWNGNDDGAVPLASGFYQATCVITRNDSVKPYAQRIFVNIADSTSSRVNVYSGQQGTFTYSGLPVDSTFPVKGPNGEDFGSATVGTSVTIYACKQGYPVIARTVALARNDTTTVNFVLR